jgi:hypothetical protein
MEKTRCAVNGDIQEGPELAEKVEKIKTVENFLRNTLIDGIDREISLGLMRFDITKEKTFRRRRGSPDCLRAEERGLRVHDGLGSRTQSFLHRDGGEGQQGQNDPRGV